MKFVLSILAAILAFVFASGALASTDGVPVKMVTAPSGITYATGGVGENSRAKVEEFARGGGFNVKLVFAWKEGNFVAGVPVTIHDTSGDKVFDLRSSDPLLVLHLPEGRYNVAAMYDGKVVERTIDAPATGLEVVHFHWAQPEGSAALAARR